MALRPILVDPDPRLRVPSAAVVAFDDDLKRLVADLTDTLAAVGGLGLAAPQVGDLRRVVVVRLEAGGVQAFINPQILTKSRLGLVEERCLSVPGVVGSVARATRLSVQAQDPAGQVFEGAFADMDAVCLQHEVDHLDGTLFVDRLSPVHRFLRWIKSARTRTPAAPRTQPT